MLRTCSAILIYLGDIFLLLFLVFQIKNSIFTLLLPFFFIQLLLSAFELTVVTSFSFLFRSLILSLRFLVGGDGKVIIIANFFIYFSLLGNLPKLFVYMRVYVCMCVGCMCYTLRICAYAHALFPEYLFLIYDLNLSGCGWLSFLGGLCDFPFLCLFC